MAERERLGTVTEARDALGVDSADVWGLVADGYLVAEREDEQEPWTIYRKVTP